MIVTDRIEEAEASHRSDVRRAAITLVPLALGLIVSSDSVGRRPAGHTGTHATMVGGANTLALAPIARVLAAGDTHRFHLDLKAGDYVRVEVDHQGIDAGASLLSTDGSLLVEVQYRQTAKVVLSTIAKASGEHVLAVRSLDTSPPAGRYVVTIKELRRAALNDVDRVRASSLFAEAEAIKADWHADASAPVLDRYRAALTYWKAAGDQQGQALAARRLGEAYHALGKPDEALPLLLESLRLGRSSSNSDAECAAMSSAARVYLDLGNTDEAAQHAERALDLSRKTSSSSEQANALNVLGDIDAFSGRTRESLTRYQGALSIASELLDRRGQAAALLNLGYTYADLSQVSDAQRSYERALALWQAVGDRRGQALTLTGIGHLHVILGENDEALASYRQARGIFERLGDRVGLGSILNGIAMVHSRSGDPEAAAEYNLKAAELFRAINHQNGEATSLLDLGVDLMLLGRREEALGHYFRALALFKAISDRRLQARVLEPIGDVYAELGRFDEALRYYEESRALAQSVGDRKGELYALNGIGALLSERGKDSQALRYLNEALQLGERLKDRFAESLVLYNLARTEAAGGRLEEALSRIRASLSLVESLRTDVASLDLRASYLASVRDRHELEVDLLMRLRERDPAGGYEARAFEVSERARARSFLDGLAQARGGIREGVDPGLLQREGSIRRSLNATAQRLTLTPGDVAHAKEATALSHEIDELMNAQNEIEDVIRTESPRYAGLVQPKPLTLHQVQALVGDPQTVLLQYFIGTSRSYVWAVTRAGITGYELPARSEIERHVRAYREAVTVPALSVLAPTAASTSPQRAVGGLAKEGGAQAINSSASPQIREGIELSRIILGPVAAHLTCPRVLIVGDGILHALPFAALPDPRSLEAHAPIPLVAGHEVINLPSMSTLALLRGDWNQQRHWQRAVMVFADPVYERDDPRIAKNKKIAPNPSRSVPASPIPEAENALARTLRDVGGESARIQRLQATRKEALGIIALTNSGDMVLDFDASRASAMGFRLFNYRIVHFAAHGIVDNRHPELSGIILSLFNRQGESQDGFLRLHDIYNLKISADLVVLSACSTGLGKEIVGEGLIGLVRGFMYAGTRRVVASLWEVDDEATSELMTRFYRGMLDEKLTPPAALRSAQLQLRKTARWKDPFYWAGFVLQGDWN